MAFPYTCKLCGIQSETFLCEDLAHLHVVIIHPEMKDDSASHVRMISSIGVQIFNSSWSRGLYGLEMSFLSPIVPYTLAYPVIYPRLSEILAVVARNLAQNTEFRRVSAESLNLMMSFHRFTMRTGNVARLLAESEGYCARLLKLLDSFGIDKTQVRVSRLADEEEISQLMRNLLHLPDGGGDNIVLSLSEVPCQATSLLNLIEKVIHITAPVSSLREEDPHTWTKHPTLSARSEIYNFRTKLRRISIKLSEASGQMPSSLYLTDIKLPGRHSLKGGAFADIFKGSHQGRSVAVKHLRVFLCQTEEDRIRTAKTFCREALIWKHLDHLNVLPFLGVDDSLFPETRSLCMIAPWMEHGNIREYLNSSDRTLVRSSETLRLAREIAFGLSYLHSEGVIHGDLRGPNILIDDEEHARLADFGLATFAESTSATANSVVGGATAWMAPELLDPEAFGLSHARATLTSDIYSYGCLCWELYADAAPFHEFKGMHIVKKVLAGDRPIRSSAMHPLPDDMWSIMESCWQQQPMTRPSVSDLRTLLRRLGKEPRRGDQSNGQNSSLRTPSARLLGIHHAVAPYARI